MANVKVNKKQLEWARNLRRYTLAQAAGQIRISKSDLQLYEAGLKQPTTTIFKKMASVYGLPEATLLLDSPPTTAPDELKDFRTRTIAGLVPEIGPETNIIISRIRAYQRKLSDMRQNGFEYMGASLPHIDPSSDPFIEGEKERARLNIPLSDQLRWYGPDEAFRNWRKIIEAQSVCIYFDRFSIDECRGVSILDDLHFPAILLNKSEPARHVAWIFSLMHEYAHILIGLPGISDQNYDNKTETFCNRFASAFLMPTCFLQEIIKPWPSAPIDWDGRRIIEFAAQFKVSQQAMALRLEAIGIAPDGFFNSFKEKQPKIKRRSKGGMVTPAKMRLYTLGRLFPTTIIHALDNGAIGQVEATQILNANTIVIEKIRGNLGI